MPDRDAEAVLEELLTELRTLKKLLHGDGEGRLGLTQKVAIMWAMHLPVIAIAGTIAGSLITWAVMHSVGGAG